jgi:protein TonB
MVTIAMPRMDTTTAASRGPGPWAIVAAAALHAGLLGAVGLLGPWCSAGAPDEAIATVSLAFEPLPTQAAIEPDQAALREAEAAVPADAPDALPSVDPQVAQSEPDETAPLEPEPLEALTVEAPRELLPAPPAVLARPVERPTPRPQPPRARRQAEPVAPMTSPNAAPGPAAPSTSAAPAGQAASGPPPQSYIAGLVAHLKRRHQYPSAARARREEGLVMLLLEIAADGSLRSCTIERSSGSQILDAAALALARDAAPYPPPPASAVLRPFRVPVGYHLAR